MPDGKKPQREVVLNKNRRERHEHDPAQVLTLKVL